MTANGMLRVTGSFGINQDCESMTTVSPTREASVFYGLTTLLLFLTLIFFTFHSHIHFHSWFHCHLQFHLHFVSPHCFLFSKHLFIS